MAKEAPHRVLILLGRLYKCRARTDARTADNNFETALLLDSNNPLSTMAPPVFEKSTVTKGIKEDDIDIDWLALLPYEKKKNEHERNPSLFKMPDAPIPSSSLPRLRPHPPSLISLMVARLSAFECIFQLSE
jgi:hypothetical protein